MASTFSVSVDLSPLMSVGPIARAAIFGNLSAAVEGVAAAGAERWQRAALKAPLWEGERQAYAASIRYQMTGEYSAEVTSDYKYVEDIESGRPAYDMKKMLNTSMKVRVGKKGRYLIIPMRHNTPGNSAHASAMPADVYAEARELSPSRVTGRGTRRSGTGAYSIETQKPIRVPTREYVWGDRLAAGKAPKLKTSHKTDPYAGMVRMDASNGGKRYSAYLTFRVMSESSAGWIRAAQPGLHIAKAVADSMQRSAERDFSAAVSQDIG